MALEIFWIIFGIFIGIVIAWYLLSKQRWGDKAEALNEKWRREIAQLEKGYDIKLEKSRSFIDKIKEENKTHLEKLAKEWQIKYIQDTEGLKKLFKDSEKIIRMKSVSSSRRSLVGKFIERFIPFLKKIPYEPSDMHFLGQPVDYIVFQGLHEDKIEKIIFVEVKTGRSKLTKREKSLKEAVEKRKVSWKEINVDTSEENTPDDEMENKETTINEIYRDIDAKLSKVKSKKIEELKLEDDIETEEEYEVICPECQEEFILQLDEGDSLESGVSISCPHCNKLVKVKQ